MKYEITNILKSAIITTTMIMGISSAWAAGPNGEGGNQLFALPIAIQKADLGVAHLSAIVNADGKLVRGSGVKKTTAVAGFPGDYIVTFNRNIRNCSYVVSLGNPRSVGVPQPGTISATGASIDVNGVYIDANDTDGNPAENPFHLHVFCNK
jgi:hypothetical protein